MNKEEAFLNIISKTLSNADFIGDDCAYLKDFKVCVSTDTLIEDVHFKKSFMTPEELGKKALLVNISDILAAGAKPLYLTVSLSGNFDEKFVEGFYKGANETCEKFDLKIIGGDLTGGEKISISITILGSTEDRKISSRKNAKAGYKVLLLGEHGSSAEGLKLLLEGKKGLSEEEKHFVKSHIEPKLYPEISEFISKNCEYEYAMTDTSDGLFDALKKVAEASGVGFNIQFDKISKKTEDFNTVLFGGEDYGLLICVSENDFKKLENLNIPEIGVVTEEKILVDNKEIKEDLRFEHFQI